MRFFYQEDLNDCGVACLATLIDYHQKQLVSPYKLKQLLPESSQQGGITFFDLINLASHFGLKGTAYFCEFDLLREQISLPFLINIKGENDLNHFVLLTEISPDKVKILDPAVKFGHRELKWDELNHFYLGQILIFQKIKKWQPQLPWKIILNYGRKHWPWLLMITLANIASSYFWFLSNFFIHYLEIWLINGTLDKLIFLQFSLYLLGGAIGYFIQMFGLHHLQQLIWNGLLTAQLNQLEIIESNLHQHNNFWEKINHQNQTLHLFFVVITKFLSNLALFPLIIWVIIQANYWILLVCLIFIIFNASINNWLLQHRLRFQNQEDWEKTNYYQQIGLYISNFTNFKKRQYNQTNYELLQTKQKKYFKTEGRNYFWIVLNDLNQQLTQRIFSLAFWFLIFFLILKRAQPTQDLLILSITTQLWVGLFIDWINNYLWFKYQKNYLYDLLPLKNEMNNSIIKIPKVVSKGNSFHLNNFGFDAPGHFYLLPNLSFKTPLQISGSQEILDSFYRAFFLKKSSLLINQDPLTIYEHDLFAIDYEAVPIASTIGANLFLHQPINENDLKKINLDYWLEKYNLQLYQTIDFKILNKSQLQVINFLGLLFSNYNLYLLNQPLNNLPEADCQLLWKLLFDLKKDKHLIILGKISAIDGLKLDQLNLDDMI